MVAGPIGGEEGRERQTSCRLCRASHVVCSEFDRIPWKQARAVRVESSTVQFPPPPPSPLDTATVFLIGPAGDGDARDGTGAEDMRLCSRCRAVEPRTPTFRLLSTGDAPGDHGGLCAWSFGVFSCLACSPRRPWGRRRPPRALPGLVRRGRGRSSWTSSGKPWRSRTSSRSPRRRDRCAPRLAPSDASPSRMSGDRLAPVATRFRICGKLARAVVPRSPRYYRVHQTGGWRFEGLFWPCLARNRVGEYSRVCGWRRGSRWGWSEGSISRPGRRRAGAAISAMMMSCGARAVA